MPKRRYRVAWIHEKDKPSLTGQCATPPSKKERVADPTIRSYIYMADPTFTQDEEDDDDEDAENGGQDGEESDEDDDMNVQDEAPIGKESEGLTPKLKKGNKANADNETGVPNIKTGALPKDFPKNQVLVVRNLPRTYKQIDLVEVFAKFGILHTIYKNHGPNGSVAFVAYSSPEEAEAVQVATSEIAQVKGKTITVNIQLINKKIKGAEDRKKTAEEKKASYEERKRKIEESKDRTVYVKNLKRTIIEDKIKEHFAECGDIESIRNKISMTNIMGGLKTTPTAALHAILHIPPQDLMSKSIALATATRLKTSGSLRAGRTAIEI
ncbi:DNA-binding protein modulo-like [Eurosta solidaginis]|uniref:DNA-binding protein modulo-like n=1 Tax=Eurosta solidaginis TaxID=178769 RepID=UPI003530D2AC